MAEIFDEASYVKYAEGVIFDLQRCFRTKPGLENIPVIEMSANLEEVCFHQALLDNHPVPSGDCLWLKRECIAQYQHRCEKMLRNLDAKERNWKKILEENEKNAKIVLSAIMKDDEGGRRKIENPYRPPKAAKPAAIRQPPVERLKKFTTDGSKNTGAAKVKGGSKKGAIGKRKSGSSIAVTSSVPLSSSVDWSQLDGSAGSTMGIHTAHIETIPAAFTSPSELSLPVIEGEDEFNLDYFADEGSQSIHLSNPEAWQAPLQGQIASNLTEVDVDTSNSGTVWRNAIAEREDTANREKALKDQRETQQEVLRKARELGQLSAATKREEEELASRDKRDNDEREKQEVQQRQQEIRDKERKDRTQLAVAEELEFLDMDF